MTFLNPTTQKTMHNFASPEVDKIVPVQFILVPSGTYKDQHHRSWEGGKSLRAINALTETIRRTAATRLNPTSVAASGGLLSVSAASQGQVAVPNGWGHQRGMFVMGFDFHMRNGEINRYYVQGATDSGEFSDRNIAPNLTFYVNNVMMLRPTTRMIAGVAGAKGWAMSKNYQPLSRFNMDTGQAHSTTATTMRPRDILARMSNSQLQMRGYTVNDDSLKVSGTDMTTSARMNSIPSTMTTRLLNAYVDSAVKAADDYEITVGDVAERAYDAVPERDSVDDQFFAMLRDRTNFSTTSFTWAHLLKVIPNMLAYRGETKAAMNGFQFRRAGDSESFGKSNDTTKLMVNLQSSVPAMMLECMVVSFIGTITNRTLDRQPSLKLSKLRLIDNSVSMVEQYAPLFESRLLSEIVPSLSSEMADYEFSAHITCAYNGEFEVKMDVNGKQSEMIAPAFCNAWFSPTMTGDEDQAIGLSEQISTVCSTVADEVLTGINRRSANTLRSLAERPDNFEGIKQGDVIGVGQDKLKTSDRAASALERLGKSHGPTLGGSGRPLGGGLFGGEATGESRSILGGRSTNRFGKR